MYSVAALCIDTLMYFMFLSCLNSVGVDGAAVKDHNHDYSRQKQWIAAAKICDPLPSFKAPSLLGTIFQFSLLLSPS